MNVPHGTVEPGFEPVREAFAGVLSETSGGAALGVVRHGRPLVELWGGLADPETRRAWAEDTAVVLFSGTKGITATVVAALGRVPWVSWS